MSLAVRQVLYALLTRPPPKPKLKTQIQVDLHVLSILSAFILSQDQTLRSIFSYSSFCYLCFTPIYGCFLSFLYSVANVLVALTSTILTLFLDFVNNIFLFFLNFFIIFLWDLFLPLFPIKKSSFNSQIFLSNQFIILQIKLLLHVFELNLLIYQ